MCKDKSRLPLLCAVEEYIKKNNVRMHTPGHGGYKNSALSLFGDMLKYDITELDGLESLYSGQGAIAESEKWAADTLGVKGLFYSAGGSTLCIQAMLYMAAAEGGRVIFAGSLHKSAINTCILLGIEPLFIKSLDENTCDNVISALKKYDNVNAVYITNPDYFGRIYDSSDLSKICRKYDIPLLVDSAHGAHLNCFDESINPLHMEASMAAQSAHKTMPALTGGAWLCVQDERYLHKVKYAMSFFGSTSPSYLILLSLELCVDWMKNHGEEACLRLKRECRITERLAEEHGCGIYQGLRDPVRITLDTAPIGISGEGAAEYFSSNGITPEMNDGSRVVFIPSPFYGAEEFDLLRRAISNLPIDRGLKEHHVDEKGGINMVLPLREASLLNSEELDIELAKGRIATEIICPCPPGTPITVPGALIGEKEIRLLKRYSIFRVKVVK